MSWDTAALHAAMPFTALLGATAVAVAPEEVRLRLEWHADRCTAGGMLHGGALTGPGGRGGRALRVPEPPGGRHGHGHDQLGDELPARCARRARRGGGAAPSRSGAR